MRTDFSKNELVKQCIRFSLMIIEYTTCLEQHKKFVIAKQLLRSATSIGANVMEAQSAESKADFIHKLKIADKEAFETWYWLLLCEQSKDYSFNPQLFWQLRNIMSILSSIIHKTKSNNTH